MINFDSKIDLFLFLHDMNVNKNRCGYFLRESNFKNNFNYLEIFSIDFNECIEKIIKYSIII